MKKLFMLVGLFAVIFISADSIAQITDCSVRRRVIAEVWKFDQPGDVINLVEEGLENRDPGEFAFMAKVTDGGASCLANHSMNWAIGDSAVEATGSHLLEINQSEEGVHHWFRSMVLVEGTFTATSSVEISYSGVASGGESHVLQIIKTDGFGLQERFPVSDGAFSYVSPVFGPGDYGYYFAIVDSYDGAGIFSRVASVDFSVTILPIEEVAIDNGTWGVVKALYR